MEGRIFSQTSLQVSGLLLVDWSMGETGARRNCLRVRTNESTPAMRLEHDARDQSLPCCFMRSGCYPEIGHSLRCSEGGNPSVVQDSSGRVGEYSSRESVLLVE